MPYRRSYRRRTYRRRYYPRKGYGAVDYIKMAKSAYSGVKYLKSLVNVEKHPLDVSLNVNPINSSGSFTLLNATAQGDTTSSRTGNSILMRSININLRYTMNSSATNTQIRTVLFWDKEVNGSTPTITDIFQNASSMSNYNHDQASRFQILADYNVNLSISGIQEMTKRIYRKLQRHTHYDGNTQTITDIVDYALWIMFVSDEPTNTPTVIARSQVLFIDN